MSQQTLDKKSALIERLENLQDDGSEGVPFSQDEIDLILASLRSATAGPRPRPGDGTDCQLGPHHCEFPECACPRSHVEAPRELTEEEKCFIACNSMTCAKLGRCRKEPSPPPSIETNSALYTEQGALTFDAFRRANVARCLKWHPAGIESWSPSDWLTAVTGELGELASLLKMRNRERDGLPGNKFSPTQKQIADELADVLTYLDLLAEALGVNLGAAAVEKFNEVSERVGFPDRIVAVSDGGDAVQSKEK